MFDRVSQWATQIFQRTLWTGACILAEPEMHEETLQGKNALLENNSNKKCPAAPYKQHPSQDKVDSGKKQPLMLQ